MLERSIYFISIENKMVEETKMPGQAELEIHATEEEIEKIKDYMDNKTKNDETNQKEEVKTSPKDTPSASYAPVVGSDESYDKDFDKLIDLVYKLGTDHTKQSIEQYR